MSIPSQTQPLDSQLSLPHPRPIQVTSGLVPLPPPQGMGRLPSLAAQPKLPPASSQCLPRGICPKACRLHSKQLGAAQCPPHPPRPQPSP